MSWIEAHGALAEALARPADLTPFRPLEGTFVPQMVEWSVNEPASARGHLRMTMWSEDLEAARSRARAWMPDACADLDEALPAVGMAGVGLAFGDGAPLRRWYRLAPVGRGDLLVGPATARLPELEEPAARLAEACGGWSQCTAVGVEADADRILRATIYFRIGAPGLLLDLLAGFGFPATPRARVMVQGLLGLRDHEPRPWPKTWIARSIGSGGGWKLYYFARRDPFRPPDAVLLDAVEASAALRSACDRLSEICPPRPAKAVPPGVVQLVGLRLAEGAGPDGDWTIYLGPT